MKLTKNSFEVLSFIATSNEKLSQRKISKNLNLSLGTVNKLIAQLNDEKAIIYSEEGIKISSYGLELLEPYKVKRAILLAAGFGSRMRPITLSTPKPLVLVHGKRIIETILDALIAADITEIYIVRGYLGEQFDVLKEKYPTITLVDNPMYNESNNMSSAYLVRDKFENAYVMEADLLIHNPSIIKKYQYRSNYTGRYVDVTDDWCFEIKNGIITKEKIGGYNCHQMCGISYYDSVDGKKMREDIDIV